MQVTHLDLFSGIGGFSLGIEEAGIKISKHYFSDVDKFANKLYERELGMNHIQNTIMTLKNMKVFFRRIHNYKIIE